MTDELKAEREAFEKWFNQSLFDALVGPAVKEWFWEVWQARAKLDHTHTTGVNRDVSVFEKGK